METQSAEVLKALDIIMEDLTPDQIGRLENLAQKIHDPTKMSVQEAMNIINELGLDIEKLQKKARRKRVEDMAKNRKQKIGVNEKCFCGSGNKYKKCCRFKDEKSPTASQTSS